MKPLRERKPTGWGVLAATLSTSTALWTTLSILILAPDARAVTSSKAKVQSRTTYSMPSGRGWAVCESYLRGLKAAAASEGPPLCDFKLDRVPGMSEPKWEELDIAASLPIVHQIELILGIGHIDPNPDRDFELWKPQREQRVKSQSQTPRLRRTRLALVLGGPVETILSYDQDVQSCAKAVDELNRRMPRRTSLGVPNFSCSMRRGNAFWALTIGPQTCAGNLAGIWEISITSTCTLHRMEVAIQVEER